MKYTKLLGSVALATLLATSFVGCGSDDNDDTEALVTEVVETVLSSDQAAIVALQQASQSAIEASLAGVSEADVIPFGDGSFSPYERVAVFPTVKDADGNLDEIATYAKVAQLANTFAKHVANVDEPTSDSETFKGANWILGGLESKTATNDFTDDDVKHHMLGIPTKLKIDSTKDMSKTNTKKVKVVEVCNSTYAAKALGVKKVGGDDGAVVANGIYHTTALPCEVTIYNDADAIYVDMLNPETIFTLFFTEVFDSAEMANPAFVADMMALPTQVKNEIFAMIYNAFDASGETYTKTSIKMGTIYSSMSKVKATTDTANGGSEPYRHYSYASDGAKEFTKDDAHDIAAKIITVMTSDEEGAVGVQESALLTTLASQTQDAPVQPAWRSGRVEPLKVPGGSWIVEACSPVYAKEALTTGEFHTAALPCEIAVFVNPDDNTTIDISFLNPEFMFGAMFTDGLMGMTSDQEAYFGNIINNINGDLKVIVDYAMENNVTTGSFDGSNVKITPVNY